MTKKLGKVQLKILYMLYLPENEGGINYAPSRIINNYGGSAIYSALKSLEKQKYINSVYKNDFWGIVYFITSEGKKVFRENMENKSYSEIKKILNIKKPEIFWKYKNIRFI
ncbi:hypothetical protein LCGC14_0838370 [marine sediment metagenome]|uniref:Transcription regulator PadR N-terminal domain-containing protein n=1 Tax=marine sediment metagenome TaxID=412755 RepID=A0A0F9PDY1_9ZZZZ